MRLKHQSLILASSALGLLMASTPLSAYPLNVRDLYPATARSADGQVIHAQAKCSKDMTAEECAKAQPQKREAGKNDQDATVPPAKENRQERKRQAASEQEQKPAPTEKVVPEKKAPPAAKPAQKPRKQQQKQDNQAAPVAEPEQKSDNKQRKQPQAGSEQSAPVPKEKPAPVEKVLPQVDQPADNAAEPKSRKEKLRGFLKEQQNEMEAAPAEGTEPAETTAPAAQTEAQPKPKPKPVQGEQNKKSGQAEKAPSKAEKAPDQAAEPKSKKEKLRDFLKKQQGDGGVTEQPSTPVGNGSKQADKPITNEKGKKAEQAKPDVGKAEAEQKPGKQPAPDAKQTESGEKPTSEPVLPGNVEAGKPRRQERVKDQAETSPLPENAAPVFDSAKGAKGEQQGAKGEQSGKAAPEEPQDSAGAASPLPETDAAAQEIKIAPADIQSLLVEQGKRFDPTTREERREFRRERRERRKRARVIEEYNDNRIIIEINNQTYIESPDYTRIISDDDDVYYDELPRGRLREVIIRPNGSRVVTVRNEYGDIIRRSRITPDGREIVLVYVPDRSLDLVANWEDPAMNLPPLRLMVPVSSYILDADTVDDPGRYYTFLEQPPIVEIERIYSVGEVSRSARLRDIMPRIDLDTINFETGSAEIGESEIDELDAIAQAIQRMLEDNPGETFLIEGHTDAVGSKASNLVLSDRRATAVARALSIVYDIPPENLITQGYGEQYLKVNTQGASSINRRVALRRITPLVAPVASAQ